MSAPQLISAWAGHWTGAGTGVTVILPPPGTVGSGEVRGGAPATREFELLDPTRLVDRVDAVVLSGGSAFGLSAADGVMTFLRERGVGVPTPFGPVPIVVGMSVFDESVRTGPPGAAAGREAALAAVSGAPFAVGRAGAGTGAATGKWRNRVDPGGIGWARMSAGSATVDAVVVVNAWGDVLSPDGRPMFAAAAGSPTEAAADTPAQVAADTPAQVAADTPAQAAADTPADTPAQAAADTPTESGAIQNTTIGVVLTNQRLSKTDCYLLAQSGHTGFARSIHPAHSRFDGDAVVALATGEITDGVGIDLLRAVAADTVAAAVRAAVGWSG